MDIQSTKIELAKLLLSETREAVLLKVREILISDKKDWWDDLNADQQTAIKEAIQQADYGETISHEDVRKNIIDKFGL